MGRPDRSDERRREFAPALARVFAEHGYRRATTSELARACEAQETILYRLWPDKQSMFVAAVEFVFQLSEQTWTQLLADAPEDADPVSVLLQYEAGHHGEFGLYRILFAGLSETEDPLIREALARVYRGFHELVSAQIASRPRSSPVDPTTAAWAVLGIGTMANIGRELGLADDPARRRLFEDAARRLVE